MKHKHQKVGIDLGIKTFATLSDPNTFDSPSSIKRAKIKQGLIQWRNSNKVLANCRTGIETSKNAVNITRN